MTPDHRIRLFRPASRMLPSPERSRAPGHVRRVVVSRCGWWRDGNCPGNERGCDDSLCKLARERSDPVEDLEHMTQEAWNDLPHPTTLTHAEFVRHYDRCPDGCRVAEQLTIHEGSPRCDT